MKLSEAIRLGSMLRPQAFRNLFVDEGSCAMGAAYEAVGITEADVSSEALKPWADRWNRVLHGHCPSCEWDVYDGTALCAMVGHLNDVHRWTREQIADWVATLEPAETTSATNEPVDVRGTESLSQPVLATREA